MTSIGSQSPTPFTDRSGVTDAVRAQILASEHWSLLSTRTNTWTEIFSRASMFITVLSAAVVAIALVAQATAFGPDARTFALLVLPVVLLIGIMTYFRLGEANSSDIGLVIGMNRLRHAYLELAPELEPYFTASSYDDHLGIGATYGAGYRYSAGRVLGGTPALVAIHQRGARRGDRDLGGPGAGDRRGRGRDPWDHRRGGASRHPGDARGTRHAPGPSRLPPPLPASRPVRLSVLVSL
jgi:hypothetical protein